MEEEEQADQWWATEATDFARVIGRGDPQLGVGVVIGSGKKGVATCEIREGYFGLFPCPKQ